MSRSGVVVVVVGIRDRLRDVLRAVRGEPGGGGGALAAPQERASEAAG